jgi:hypothetical protein
MAKNIIEFTAATADTVTYANYTSSKTVLGPDIRQFTGSTATEWWIGPNSTRFQDPTQDTGLSNWGDLDAITYSGSKQWVFALRGAVATSTNLAEIAAWEFDKDTYTYTYRGRTGVTQPIGIESVTFQGIKANLEYYSTGSVEVNGTSVTGSGTDFIADRIPVGARIGFGSTNPADITTWYRISGYPAMTNKTGFNALVYAIAVDSSGSMYVGGNFTSYSGSAVNRIVKLTPSGLIDTSFNPGDGFNSAVNVIRLDSSGSLYVGGAFTSYSGSTENRIIKLNTNGTKDTSFDNSTGFNASEVVDIQFDSTGSLWVGGSFTTYKGASSPRLAKVLTTGLRDTTYVTTNSPNSAVRSIAVDNNDDVYIGGDFTQVGATANNSRYIAKILKTGGLDSTFVVGAAGTSNAFSSTVTAIHYKPSTNSIIVGGSFTQWKGVNNFGLTELSAVGDVIITGNSIVASLVMPVYSFVLDNSGSMYINYGAITQKYNANTLRAYYSTTQPVFNPNITFGNAALSVYRPALNPTQDRLYLGSPNTTIDAGMVCVDTTHGNHDMNFHTTPNYTSQQLTIDASAGTFPAGTPYVIENLQFTAIQSNRGVGLIQGLSWDDFTIAGTTIPVPTAQYAALSKGWYNVGDLGYQGLDNEGVFRPSRFISSGWTDTRILPKQSEDTDHVFIRNASNQFSRINIKDSQLRVHGTGAWSSLANPMLNFSTPNQIVIPAASSINGFATGKFTVATMQTGSASGSLSMFGDASGQIVQTTISDLQNNVTPPRTTMTETPPGSSTTFTAAGNVGRVYYMSTIDRLIQLNASSARSYITNYRTDLQFPTLTGTLYGRDTFNQLAIENSYDRAFLGNFGQLQGNTANANAPRYPDIRGTGFFGAVENGVLHLCRPLNTIENNMYAIPLGCEAAYVDFSKNAVYTPKYTLSNVVAASGLYLNTLKEYGNNPFILPAEPVIIHYRTTGIDDDSGAWTLFTTIDSLNEDISCQGTLDTLEIQFRISYQVAGNTCLPSRLYGFTFVYEDERTDSHYAASTAKSNLTNRIFAWQQTEPWYGNIPELKIRLYNAANNKIVYYDTTATAASGTWQYSTDGTTWLAWDATADAVGNYIRYVADFIPAGVKLRVGLNRI